MELRERREALASRYEWLRAHHQRVAVEIERVIGGLLVLDELIAVGGRPDPPVDSSDLTPHGEEEGGDPHI